MGKKKDEEMQELSEMMVKHTLGGNVENDQPDKDNETQKDDVNESLMQVIDITSAKVEDIVESWKDLVADPLNCNAESVTECLNHPELLKNALLSTFTHLKEIQEIFFEFAISDVEKANKQETKPNTEKKEQTFINTQIFSSDSESDSEAVVDTGAQCDLSEEVVEDAGDLSEEDTEKEKCVVYSTTVEYIAVKYKQDDEDTGDCLNNGADETIYEDCEEEIQQEDGEKSKEVDETYDGEEEENSPESSDTEGEDDPSWMLSDGDSSGSDYEEDKRMTVKDMPQVNFAKTNVKSLGLWLSDNGPVQLNIMCHCKGMCVKNCACRTAGISCSVRCGCKTDKCKWRRKQAEIEEDIFDDEGFKNNLRPQRRVLADRDLNKPYENTATPAKTREETNSFSTPALFLRPEKPKVDESPGNEIFMTPACRPPAFSTDSSLLTSTAKKRNKKKLFTESIGPQDF